MFLNPVKSVDLQISQVGERFAEAQSSIGYFLPPVKQLMIGVWTEKGNETQKTASSSNKERQRKGVWVSKLRRGRDLLLDGGLGSFDGFHDLKQAAIVVVTAVVGAGAGGRIAGRDTGP